jgi:16S rRNA (uracil1498-N3)-methyltransferase
VRSVRIYQAGEYTVGHLIELSATASQHVGVVLRMQVGAPLTLFCGDNREFSATIVSISKKKVVVQINAVADVPRESSRAIHLVQAISKGERMEMVIQKAVELGVASITPLLSAHCVVRWDAERQEKKQAQWKSIAISACEQSGRNQLPVFHDICSFDSYLETRQAETQLILHPYTEKSWRDYTFARGDIALIIGPEGGWSDEEIRRATSKHCYPLRLGPRVLRTETAAIAALSVLQAVAGDL